MSTSARAIAEHYVRAVIHQHESAGKHRLPLLRELARAAGVSAGTMGAALRALQEEGLVRVRRGGGVRLAAGDTASVQVHSRARAHERVAADVERDILSGVHSRGEALPFMKTLTLRYGACGLTVRRALALLVEQRTLQVVRRRYAVPQPQRPPEGYNTVALVMRGRGGRDHSPAMLDRLRALDEHCGHQRLRLKLFTYQYHQNALVATDGPEGQFFSGTAREGLLGTVVWTAGLTELDYRPLFDALAACNRPVAILDEDVSLRLPTSLTRHCPAKLFTTTRQTQAGFAVGQYLLGQGHRCVAYLSTSHDVAWSQQRLAGIANAFKWLPPEAFRVFTCPSVEKPDMIGYERARAVAMMRDELTRSWSNTRDEMQQEMKRALSGMAGQIGQRISDNHHTDAMLELCEQANKESEISAWVASHDRDAVVCNRFIKARPSPARNVELVSFDDSTAACVERFSSYNFNTAAVQGAMASFLLDGGARAGMPDRGKHPHSIEGFLTLRGFTWRSQEAGTVHPCGVLPHQI